MTILIVVHAFLDFGFKWNQDWNAPMIVFYGILGVALVLLYIRIIKVMRELHWYEYERTKKANLSFLIGSLSSLFLFMYF